MKQSTINKEVERAKVRYKVLQSHVGRNYYLFYGVVAIYAVAALWSATTAAGNIYIRAAGMMGQGTFALIAAGIAAVAIVGLQFVSGKGTVDDLQIGILGKDKQGEWNYSFSDRSFFFLKATAFLFATAVSVILSINGVKTANEWMRNDVRPFTEQVADVSFFDAQIEAINVNIRQEQTRKWKGVLTTDASRRIAKYEDKKAQLIAQRQKVINETNERNKEGRATYDAKTEGNSAMLQGFGGVAEFVCCFCIVFIGLYDDGLYREAKLKGGATAGAFGSAGIGFQRTAPAYNENSSPEMSYKPVVVEGFRRNVTQQAQQAQPVATAQQSATTAQQPTATTPQPQHGATNGKPQQSATTKQRATIQSAIRMCRSRMAKAEAAFVAKIIDEERKNAILAAQQTAIAAHRERLENLEA